jgi:hypothetical protein
MSPYLEGMNDNGQLKIMGRIIELMGSKCP